MEEHLLLKQDQRVPAAVAVFRAYGIASGGHYGFCSCTSYPEAFAEKIANSLARRKFPLFRTDKQDAAYLTDQILYYSGFKKTSEFADESLQ